ncbi:MAG: glycosyltransferase family 10 [Akkermansia sp.]|nr:glycosyltransferase family 10 [Akkermansia sp.]
MTQMKTIRVAFCDFYEGFEYSNFLLYKILTNHYNVIIDQENPDYLIYSCYSSQFLRYNNCIKIFWTGEPVIPNFNFCDYAISFTRETFGGRNLFFPLAVYRLVSTDIDDSVFLLKNPEKRKFCSFVYSNDTAGEGAIYRKKFCERLMESYKRVDCAGRVLHNCDDDLLSGRFDEKNWHQSKILFLSKYKFNIAFENSNIDGYLTEKIVDPFFANTVPIYWGSEGNVSPFPKEAMICANDFEDMSALIDYIKYVDTHDVVYNELLRKNPLNNGKFDAYLDLLENYIVDIVEKGKQYDKDVLNCDPLNRVREFAVLSVPALRCMKRILRELARVFTFFR